MSNDQITTEPTPLVDGATSRRWFLGAAAAVTAGGVLAACGSNDDEATTSTTGAAGTTAATTATTKAADAGGDLKVAQLAAGLEVLAVATYKGALEAATAKKLGDVPPAVAEFAKTAMSQHQTALDAWNKVITGAGQQAVSSPPASLKKVVDEKFAQVKDVGGVAALALLLEQTAADTYLSANKTLTGKDALTMAGALQIVDQEHAAILLFVQGKYPVPEVFQGTDNAFKG
ncbi:MAG TPA: ferritin-like domain-containing protein [Acidimicrobiales bacterium]|nr:ferritin-like domain-containing protein [Acidimicrobiales bacterium]